MRISDYWYHSDYWLHISCGPEEKQFVFVQLPNLFSCFVFFLFQYPLIVIQVRIFSPSLCCNMHFKTKSRAHVLILVCMCVYTQPKFAPQYSGRY